MESMKIYYHQQVSIWQLEFMKFNMHINNKEEKVFSTNLNNFSFYKNAIKAKLKEVFYFLINTNEQGKSGLGLEIIAHNSHLRNYHP